MMIDIENRPISCGVITTRRCDLRCQYCNMPNSTWDDEMDFEKWKRAIDISISLGIEQINFLGGEASFHPDIEKILKYILNETELDCSMVTNAFRKNQRILSLLKIGLPRLSFSIDNLNPDFSISPVKCKSSLELIDFLENNGATTLASLRTYCVISKKNMENIPELVKWMTEKEIHCYFLPYHWSRNEVFEHRKSNNDLAIVDDENVKKLNELIDKLIEMKNLGYLVDNSIEFLKVVPQHITMLDWHCSRLSELRFDADGQMMCCCDKKGDVNKRYSIFDLEDVEKYKEFLKMRKKDADKCQGCLWPSSVESELRWIERQNK